MKLSKAIEILSLSANAGQTTSNQDFKDAQKLGIEALKVIRWDRITHLIPINTQLPGETEEGD